MQMAVRESDGFIQPKHFKETIEHCFCYTRLHSTFIQCSKKTIFTFPYYANYLETVSSGNRMR